MPARLRLIDGSEISVTESPEEASEILWRPDRHEEYKKLGCAVFQLSTGGLPYVNP